MNNIGEATDWVPLHAALAWVASRNSAVFQRAIERPDNNLYAPDSWDEDVRATATAALENAWLVLRSAIAAGKVIVRGFPYQEMIASPNATSRPNLPARMGHTRHFGSRAGDLAAPVGKAPNRPPLKLSKEALDELRLRLKDCEEDEEEDEGEDNSEPTNSPLPPTEVQNLILGGTGMLRPADWAIVGGQGWHSVVISRVDLAEKFAARDPDDLKHGGKTIFRSQNRSYLSDVVEAVIIKFWPNGFPDGLGESERNKEINVKVDAEIQAMVSRDMLAGMPEVKLKKEASAPVIRKVLQKLKVR